MFLEMRKQEKSHLPCDNAITTGSIEIKLICLGRGQRWLINSEWLLQSEGRFGRVWPLTFVNPRYKLLGDGTATCCCCYVKDKRLGGVDCQSGLGQLHGVA